MTHSEMLGLFVIGCLIVSSLLMGAAFALMLYWRHEDNK